jgi:hypothetical protein
MNGSPRRCASGRLTYRIGYGQPHPHLLIRKHDKSDIVELSTMALDWHYLGGRFAHNLQSPPTTELVLSQTEDDFCSHILINQPDGSRVRVIEAVN